MKKLFLLVLISFALCRGSSAQSSSNKHNGWIFGPSLGYQYQSGHFLKTAAWGLFALNQSQYLKFQTGANFTWMMDRTTIIPELGVSYYLNNVAVWPFLKAELTPYTATGKFGVSLFSLVEVTAGYGFNLKTKKDFRSIDGFAVGLELNLPLNLHL